MSLSFENLENPPITIQCQLDTYAPQLSGSRKVSTALPIIDSGFAYLGIGFLAAAAVIESGAWLRKKQPAKA